MQQIAQKFTKYEWLILLFILAPLLYPNGVQGYLLAVIPLLWMIRWLGERHFIPPTPLDVIILLLLMTVGVSMIAVFDPALSFPKIAGVLLGISLFYGAVDVMRRFSYGSWYIFTFFLLSGSGMAAVGLIGTRWSGPFAALNRIKTAVPTVLQTIPGTIDGSVNPNELAGVLGWVLPLLIILLIGLWHTWPPLIRTFAVLLITIFSLLLVATYSRGGIIACGLSLLLVYALTHKWGRWLLATAVLATVVLVAYDLDSLLFAGQGLNDAVTINGRLEIWSRALYGIADFPFTGMSMNGFRRVVHILYPLFLIPPTSDLGHAHNHLLQVALDLGIPGLIAYLGLWFTTFTLLWQSWRQASQPTTRFFALGLIGSLLTGWLFGMLDAIALGARPGFMWWLLLAMSIGVYDATRNDRRFLAKLSVTS